MNAPRSKQAVVIGGGPAGLMAAEVMAQGGLAVTVYERKPSLARKFLMAGRGGLNLTHSEPLESFLPRYGDAEEFLAPAVRAFPPEALRAWCEGLGEPTFTGSSGRIFPKSLKASPLLRAWQKRLKDLGVDIRLQREWRGWDAEGRLLFAGPDGEEHVTADAAVLALGGASWPRLGSDGGWTAILAKEGVPLSPLRPANCGFAVDWPEVFRARCAGQPLKPVVLSFAGRSVQGEAMITENGIEGGAVYALSSALRGEIEKNGAATLTLDLRPGVTPEELERRLSVPRRGKSFANFMRVAGGLSPVAMGILRNRQDVQNLPARELAALIKALPLRLDAPFPIARAISAAGGIKWEAMDGNFMLKAKPGVFACGEMLDWEAPTGGYLLQACFSTARAAALGALKNSGLP